MMNKTTHLIRPTREEIALLPLFPGLPLDRIQCLETGAQFERALAVMNEAVFVGFDTESKPTFFKDAAQNGPHVVQIAVDNEAFIVQIRSNTPSAFLKALVESERIVKIGFGLTSDRAPLARKLGLKLNTTVDLSKTLRSLGYKQELGVKAAVAIVLGQNIQKSKKVTTSNWANAALSASQLLYAANDAYAALKVFQAMGSPYAAPGSGRSA